MNHSLPRLATVPGRKSLRYLQAVGMLILCGAFAGCSSTSYRAAGPATEPASYNVYAASAALPPDVKRVAILPLVADTRYGELIEGCKALDPVLNAELIRTRKFEVVRVTPQGLKDCTGQIGWTGEEALPAEFFSALQEAYGCDAVLFCQLTEFRAYAPLAVGWRMKLVSTRTKQILWAGDELFDAAREPAVPERAYRYWFFPPSSRTLTEDWIVDNSPRRFAQYTVEKLFATLPQR